MTPIEAQKISGDLAKLIYDYMANKGFFRLYTDIPSAPAQSSPTTITPADHDGGGLGFFSIPGGGVKQVKTSGNFSSGYCMRSYVGTAGAPFVMVNTAGDIFGSAGVAAHGISSVTDVDYANWRGLDINNPLLIRSGTGGNGIALAMRSGGSHHLIMNAVVDTPNASGLTANNGISGSNFYENIDLSFLRVFNAGQEGICYVVNTGASYDGTNICNNLTVHDCFSFNSQREGTQVKGVNNLLMYKNTCINSGQGGVLAQNGLFQVVDCNGLARDSIYDGAPEMGIFSGHGMTIRNHYFRWTTNTVFQILRSSIQSWAGTSTRLNGQPNLFDGCIFHCDNVGTLAKFCQTGEENCNIEFRNCIFSNNITALYDDIRSGSPTNSLIGTINTNGNSKQAITAPTYGNNYNLYSDYTNHGLCNSATYQNLHMGYRQPG